MTQTSRLASVSLVLLGLTIGTTASAQEAAPESPPLPPAAPAAASPSSTPDAPIAPTPPAPPGEGRGDGDKKEHHRQGGNHHDRGDRSQSCCGLDQGTPAWGGLGYAFGGLTMGTFHGLEESLRAPANLGPGYGVAHGGLTFGGGGGALLFGRLWIGGKGYGISVGTGQTPNGTAKLRGGGGGFELGVAAVNHGNWLVIPFVGLGGFSYSLTIDNVTNVPFKLSAQEIVPARGNRELTAGFATGEVGVRVMRLLFSGGGGFAAGAEVGYTSALGRASWTGPEKINSGLESADLGAGYVRLLFGGGGFFSRH